MTFGTFCDFQLKWGHSKHVLTSVIIIINGAARDIVLCQRGNDQHFSLIWWSFYLNWLFNMILTSCVRLLGKVCLGLHHPTPDTLYASLLCKLMTLGRRDWNIFHVSGFSNENTSDMGAWVEQGIADTHAQLQVDFLVVLHFDLFFLVRAGSPPTGQFLRDTPDILFRSILNLKQESKLNWECWHNTALSIFLFSYLYYINNGHVHFIVQRNH